MTSVEPSDPSFQSRSREQRLAELGCEVVSQAPGAYVVATLGPVVVACVGRDAGAAGLDAFSLANAQVARKHPRMGHLIIFSEGCSLPGVEERQAVVEVLRSFQGQIMGAGVVVEGRGLPTVLLRSIVNVVDRISRSAHPARTFASVADAVRWLAQTLGGEDVPYAARLEEVAIELRRVLLS